MSERLLMMSDLAAPGGRWIFSRQGVRKLANRDPEFPQPAATSRRGRQRLWSLESIIRYEVRHPELLDPYQRKRKQLAAWRGRKWRPPEPLPWVQPELPWPWPEAHPATWETRGSAR